MASAVPRHVIMVIRTVVPIEWIRIMGQKGKAKATFNVVYGVVDGEFTLTVTADSPREDTGWTIETVFGIGELAAVTKVAARFADVPSKADRTNAIRISDLVSSGKFTTAEATALVNSWK